MISLPYIIPIPTGGFQVQLRTTRHRIHSLGGGQMPWKGAVAAKPATRIGTWTSIWRWQRAEQWRSTMIYIKHDKPKQHEDVHQPKWPWNVFPNRKGWILLRSLGVRMGPRRSCRTSEGTWTTTTRIRLPMQQLGSGEWGVKTPCWVMTDIGPIVYTLDILGSSIIYEMGIRFLTSISMNHGTDR